MKSPSQLPVISHFDINAFVQAEMKENEKYEISEKIVTKWMDSKWILILLRPIAALEDLTWLSIQENDLHIKFHNI